MRNAAPADSMVLFCIIENISFRINLLIAAFNRFENKPKTTDAEQI